MTRREYEDVAPRLGVNFGSERGRLIPWFWESSEEACTAFDPASGGYAPIASIGRFFEALLSPQRLEDAGSCRPIDFQSWSTPRRRSLSTIE